jgi:hypothetical protein
MDRRAPGTVPRSDASPEGADRNFPPGRLKLHPKLLAQLTEHLKHPLCEIADFAGPVPPAGAYGCGLYGLPR